MECSLCNVDLKENVLLDVELMYLSIIYLYVANLSLKYPYATEAILLSNTLHILNENNFKHFLLGNHMH